jgi:chromosome segregation ATPase
MSNPPQFLTDFMNNMNKLKQMNQSVQKTIDDKKNFNTTLNNRLKNINGLIQKLATDINNLKAKVDGLQGQVNTNSTAIGDKDKQIADLAQKMKTLEAEKVSLTQQLGDLQNKTTAETGDLQKRINDAEAKIRALIDQNAILEDRAKALDAELTSKGDLPRQHAEEIKKQADGFKGELEKQRLANQAEIDKLNAKIVSDEAEMLNLQKQLQDKANEAASHAQNVTNAQNQCQGQLAQLNAEKDQLIAENKDLLDRIKEANSAIIQALTNLQALTESAPNVQNQKDLEDLLGQIEASIMAINTAMQTGQPASPNRGDISVLDETGNPFTGIRKIQQQIALNKLQEKLSKESIPARQQKLKTAISFIQNNKADPTSIENFLQKEAFKFQKGNNDVTFGGKKRSSTKRRKNKQKGGFTYKNSKRRGIHTSSMRGVSIPRNFPAHSRSSGRGRRHSKK